MRMKRLGIATVGLFASIAATAGIYSAATPSSGGARLTSTSTPIVFDPCWAINHGKYLHSTGKARRAMFALSPSYTSSYVVVTECIKSGNTWTKLYQTNGRAGYNGFAHWQQKREGDGKSPTGIFPLLSAFGNKNPGTYLPYRTLHTSGDCWGSTPGQPHYNQYYSGHCLPTDENLSATMLRGPYRQAVVIGYNLPHPAQGLGSAIFFHVGGTGSTAGCIAINQTTLTRIMHTLHTNDYMVMGPKTTFFRS